MLRFLVLSTLVACAFGNVVLPRTLPLLDGRIVGGENATIEEFPYQVIVHFNSPLRKYFCGGSIISPRNILTAGHCCTSPLAIFYSIEHGATKMGSGTIVYVAKIKRHINYNANNFQNDICVIRLVSNIPESPQSKSIKLAIEQPIANDIATVTGYGVLTPGGSLPDALQVVRLPVVPKDVCDDAYLDGMMCAGLLEGGKDSCQGDSGGPLVLFGYLAGIVSWGNGCALPGQPGVYSDVFYHGPWIEENLQH